MMMAEQGIVRRRGVAAAGVLTLVTAGCTGNNNPGPTTYVTVPAPAASSSAPPASAGPSSPATASASAARSATGSSTPSQRAMTRLPGPCDTTIPLGSVVDALGRPSSGKTAFVVGEPDRTIDRVSYINCRYGLSKPTAEPEIEIGVSLYRSPAKAAARLRPTIED